MSIQSVLINKKKFSLINATKWILDNNYKVEYEIDEIGKYYRFKQYEPRKNGNYVIKKINDSMGKRVALVYKEHVGVPTSCFGDTGHFVSDVIVVE